MHLHIDMLFHILKQLKNKKDSKDGKKYNYRAHLFYQIDSMHFCVINSVS